MKLVLLQNNNLQIPIQLQPYIYNAQLYDSSCSPAAKVIFIDKDCGYFLKCSAKGSLEKEALMTQYFCSKGLSTRVVKYMSEDKDWILTEKISGEDCLAKHILENPTKLCDIIAEKLSELHNHDYIDCPIANHTEAYLNIAQLNYLSGNYDKTSFPDSFGYKSAREAWEVIEKHGWKLQSDTLLHGDYCLPNIILNDWKFSGFIDLGNGGVGDRHVDIFWGIWTLMFNLKTDKYRSRFYDAYGRDKIDDERLRIVAAAEVFG